MKNYTAGLMPLIAFFGALAGCNGTFSEVNDTRVGDSGTDTDNDWDADTDGGDSEDPLDRFFGLVIHNINIEVDEDGVAALFAEPKVYTHGSVAIDNTEYEDVGVRLKGSAGSFVPLDGDYPDISGDGNGKPGKSAFIVDFNRYLKGTDYLGLEKLTINNMVQDPSCIHEFLGYSLFREGDVPAARSGFALVMFNGEDKGLYAIIETPDNDEFLKKWYGTAKGNLYEGEYGADLRNDTYELYDQDNGSDKSKQDLKNLLHVLEGIESKADALSVLEEHFDLDEYLAFAATEIYLGHWDGYAMSANNYNIYHNLEDDTWSFLPWGIDQLFEDTMGRFNGVMSSPGPSWEPGGGRIHGACFSSAECRSRLHQAFVDLLDRVDKMGLAAMAQRARDLVVDLALAESIEFGDSQKTIDFLDHVTSFIDERRSAIEMWLPCLIGNTVDNDDDKHDGCTSDCDDFHPGIHPEAEDICDFIDTNCNHVLDDPPECPKCMYQEGPDGAEYSFCVEHLTWTEAREHCLSQGQDLASMHNEEIWDFLTFTMMERTGIEFAWIGLHDRDREGKFAWTDGSNLDYEHWIPDCPKPWGEEEDCTLNRPWGWEDVFCEEDHGFICKTP
ncbi:MAG: hypothetical protein GY847_02040 [Proteobacteria bacterium]|nr:hypothetical protein [Pseudomonadota bacterium]